MAGLEKQAVAPVMSRWSRKSAAAASNQDFHAWLLAQAAALRARHADLLDWDNLAEELEAIGRKERNELRSHLQNLVSHLLKWAYQPAHRSNSWTATINTARNRIEDQLEESPSLKAELERLWSEPKTYARACRDATLDTGGQVELLSEPPWVLSQVLDSEFFPQ